LKVQGLIFVFVLAFVLVFVLVFAFVFVLVLFVGDDSLEVRCEFPA